MSRPAFTLSHETKKIVNIFTGMSINQIMAFAEATKRAGFHVTSTTPAYTYARKVAERDHGTVIDAVRGFGFKKLGGIDTSRSVDRHLMKIRRTANRGAARTELADTMNLNPKESRANQERRTRLRIIHSNAEKPTSNRREVTEPPTD